MYQRIKIIKKKSYPEYLIAVKNKKFWEEFNACFPLILHGPHRKRRVVAAGTSVRSYYRAAIEGDTDLQKRPTILPMLHVFVAVGTEPLPSNERRDALYRSVA
jgi:hypothetical protein